MAADTDIVSLWSMYALQSGKNLLMVSQNIPGTFDTVTGAVTAASDGDIILIFPGIYEESLDIRSKDIILIGTDRDSCIIRYNTCDYLYPVLNISSGVFCNLTLYGYREPGAQEKPYIDAYLVTPENVNNYFAGYTVHIDDDREYGRSVMFSNCSIVSENSNCIGMGLRNHFTAAFSNCSFRSTGCAGIFYVHDSANPLFAGTDMHLIFTDNIWENYGYPYLMLMTSLNPADRIEVTFKNVTTYCYASNKADLYYYDNSYTGADIRTINTFPGLFSATPVYAEQCRFGTRMAQLKAHTPYDAPGIYYIYDEAYAKEDTTPKTLYPIYIRNPLDLPGFGWGGSFCYFLTPDSSGNTLSEMNYPVLNG